MFKKEEEQYIDEIETIIGPSVKVEGDFSAAGNVVVEGTVFGSLKTEKNLKVGEGAKIFANVSCGSAFIAGEMQGNVKIKDNLELTSTAKIYGDIKTKTIIIARGATVFGKITAGEEKKTKIEKNDKEKFLKNKNFDDVSVTPAL